MESILLVKKRLGRVKMMSGLVNASFSLLEWQAVEMIFFAPWLIKIIMFCILINTAWFSILGLHSRDFRYNLRFPSAMLVFQIPIWRTGASHQHVY